MKASCQSGFTLLEAVVAMTLLAVVGGVLLSWLNTGFRSLQRIEVTEARIEAAHVAMAYLETLNPMRTPSGSVQLGHYQLDWQSSPLTEARPVVGRHGGAPGIYDAVLFRVDVRIQAKGEPLLSFTVESAGHDRISSRRGEG